jgi:hypothetical protein
MHMVMLRDGLESKSFAENSEALVLSGGAIQSIRKRMSDPDLSISDGVMMTVLTLACNAVSHLTGQYFSGNSDSSLLDAYNKIAFQCQLTNRQGRRQHRIHPRPSSPIPSSR